MNRFPNAGELTELDLEQIAGGAMETAKKQPSSAPADTPPPTTEGTAKKKEMSGGDSAGEEARLAPDSSKKQ